MTRLQKYIANNSEISRRKAEEMILEGKVLVDGEVITELGFMVANDQEVVVENRVIYYQEKVYYILNKPTKVICSTSDDKGRTTVLDLVTEQLPVYPIGRLDYDTSGILLLTNDGELANGLMHPRYKIEKRYIVKLTGNFTKRELLKLQRGVEIDGRMTARAKVRIVNKNPKSQVVTIEMIIKEGRNRQIRKMVEAVGCKVTQLKRVGYAFFDLELEKIPTGAYRSLTVKEVKRLFNWINNGRDE